MSLTGMLKGNTKECNELKRIISIIDIDIEEISKEIKPSDIKAVYKLKDHKLAGQLGTAFDYLARFVLKHYQYKLKVTSFEETFVAKYGLYILLEKTPNKDNNYIEVYDTAIHLIEEYIKGNDSDELFERIIGVSVYFAKLESIYRNGYTKEKEISLRKSINPFVKEELITQINIFKKAFEKKFNVLTKENVIYYNPTFGICSQAVGGADADIVIGDTLIDFKSTKYLDSIENDFKQLVGYYLFSKVVNNPNNINKICLYFSRYGKFVEYEFTEKDKNNILKATKEMKKFVGA